MLYSTNIMGILFFAGFIIVLIGGLVTINGFAQHITKKSEETGFYICLAGAIITALSFIIPLAYAVVTEYPPIKSPPSFFF